MSMGQTEISAKKVVNTYSKQDLRDILKIFGEEQDATKFQETLLKKEIKKDITNN